MPTPDWFRDLDVDDAEDVVEESVPDGFETRMRMYEGDHWQDRDGWIGPHPGPNEKNADVAWDEIERAFTPKGVIAEVVDRHVGGVVGRQPLWGFVPRDRDDFDPETGDVVDDLADGIEALESDVETWWADRDVDDVLSEAVATALVGGRAAIRLFVPRGVIESGGDGTGVVPDGPLPEQLDRLYVDALGPDVATVYEDPDTRAELGIVVSEVETGNPTEVGSDTDTRVELSWVDDEGATHLRVLRDGEDPVEFEFDFGGRLMVHEIERQAIVSDQVVAQQRALNLANSMIPRNVITGGFLERVLLNAQMPGEIKEDPDSGTKRFEPDPMVTGPGTTNYVVGVREVDAEGDETIKQPRVEYRDPVPVDPSRGAKEAHYHDILDEVDQRHVIISGDATPSGESREQARAEFRRSLNDSRPAVESAVRWLVEASTSVADEFAGAEASDRPVDRVRVDATAVIDDGPISSEEMRAVGEMVAEGMMSKEAGLKRLGVRDVRAEIDRIEDQENADISRAQERAAAILSYTRAGADLVTAARATGMSEDRSEDLFGEIADRRRRREDRREQIRGAIRDGGENGGQPGDDGGTAPGAEEEPESRRSESQ